MSDIAIQTAFESALNTWATANNIPVAWENVRFSKPSSGVFVEPFIIPNANSNGNLSVSRITLRGLFQVNCWGVSGKGLRELNTLAQEIMDLFPSMYRNGNLSVDTPPARGRAIQDASGWTIIPVTIYYRYESV
jgi:hypothetical protein